MYLWEEGKESYSAVIIIVIIIMPFSKCIRKGKKNNR